MALAARGLDVFQWQQGPAPATMLRIIKTVASVKVFHHMRRVYRRGRPLPFMAHRTANILKRMLGKIRMDLEGLRGIGHFWIIDTHMTRHAALGNAQFRIPYLLDLKRRGPYLLLEFRILHSLSKQPIIVTLILFPLRSVICGHRPHEQQEQREIGDSKRAGHEIVAKQLDPLFCHCAHLSEESLNR